MKKQQSFGRTLQKAPVPMPLAMRHQTLDNGHNELTAQVAGL